MTESTQNKSCDPQGELATGALRSSKRVLIDRDPFPEARDLYGAGPWPSRWVGISPKVTQPAVVAFRLDFTVREEGVIRLHVSADERYILYLDGQVAGRGSERGDADNWFFESYDLSLTAGDHRLVAVVWCLGTDAPRAQISVEGPRFLLAAQGSTTADMNTGRAPWEVMAVRGYQFTGTGVAWGTGSKIAIDGAVYPWGIESGHGEGWMPAISGEEARPSIGRCGVSDVLLKPATLPPMLEQPRRAGQARHACRLERDDENDGLVRPEKEDGALTASWTALLGQDQPLIVPSGQRQRIIVDLGDYVCAYPELELEGGRGAQVRIHWAESLYDDREGDAKGHRDQVDGKWFRGVGDAFTTDGGKGRRFSTLWWEAGRYLEIEVATATEPLTITRLGLCETRYPLEQEAAFRFSDPRLERCIPLMVRSLQMCSHETYMDCPYYEQLMYVGDTRLEALITYAITHDTRLPAKAVRMFAESCDRTGLTGARYPARGRQTIPGFSLWWVAMVHDLARWRGERDLVTACLPRIRGVLDAFLAKRGADGLIRVPEGWNFVDWVPTWTDGCPPLGGSEVCGITSWLLVLALRVAAELEDWTGEAALAARDRLWAQELGVAAEAAFWNPSRGLMADDLKHQHWSQHAQSLAILSGHLTPERAEALTGTMLNSADIAPATIYFSHYLFEVLARTGRGEALLKRLEPWFGLAQQGFRTTFEFPGLTRSDCHAWGAHPLYHYAASILGVQPAVFGYEKVTIRPLLGGMTQAGGRLVHPHGPLDVDYSVANGDLRAKVTLPPGLTGTLIHGNQTRPLHPGTQEILLP